MTRAAILLALLLDGCAGVQANDVYVPPDSIKSQSALDNDRAICLKDAEAYPKRFDLTTILTAGAQGTLANLPSAAISPLATGLGGVGRASSEAVSELGLMSTDQRAIYAKCLCIKGAQSGNYLALDVSC